jgi:LytS/YehU family sensor histidine kinase
VPPLLLQPLVENAVRHGVAREPGAAWIEIAARLADDGSLRIRVANSARAGRLGGEGFGLRLTRRRLDETYAGGAGLQVVQRDRVVEAILRVPHLDSPAAAPAA